MKAGLLIKEKKTPLKSTAFLNSMLFVDWKDVQERRP